MTILLTCPNGHRWETADLPSSAGSPRSSVCPVCGSTCQLDDSREPSAGGPVSPPADPPLAGDVPSGGKTLPLQRGPLPPAQDLTHYGGYEIRQELGRGGMAVVYQAWQASLQRVVALKMILGGVHAGPHQLARFRAEAEVLARLRHPNFVQIHDVGERNGHPYLALEFVDGGSLADRLDGRTLPAPQAAKLVETLARATHCAHQHGIIHRDLKPNNVLLASSPGSKPGAPGKGNGGGVEFLDLGFWTPKISDFGLAKRLDVEKGQTASRAIVGTACYMPPEQALGRSKWITPAADIYALGAILYELLAGRPPFDGPDSLTTLKQVIADEPVPPTRLRPKVPPDLETVCPKCLEKEPARRYATAEDLAEDLRRFLTGEPIRARPVTRRERLAKWAKRRPVTAALWAVSVAAVVLLVVSNVEMFRQRNSARRERQVAEEKRQEARQQRDEARRRYDQSRRSLYALHLGKVAAAALGDEPEKAAGRELLADTGPCPLDLRDLTWRLLYARCGGGRNTVVTFPAPVNCVAFSPDGKLLAVGTGAPGRPGEVRLRDLVSGKDDRALAGHAGAVTCVAFAPDGKVLASGSADQTVKLWDLAGGGERATIRGHQGPVLAAVFSPDGRVLCTGSKDGTAAVWDAQTGEKLGTLPGHAGGISALAVSADGRTLATGSEDRAVMLWDLGTRQRRAILVGHAGPVGALGFDPAGQTLAAGTAAGEVRLWDVSAPALRLTLPGHGGGTHSVCFAPDGRCLVTSGSDGLVKLWDPVTGQERAGLKHDEQKRVEVRAVAIAADGTTLASGGADQRVVLRRAVAGGTVPATLVGHLGEVTSVAFAPDRQTLATGSADATVRLWDLVTGQERAALRGHGGGAGSVAFAPDGRTLASGDGEGVVRLWDVAAGKESGTLRGHRDGVRAVAFAADGRTLASGSKDGTVKLWDTASGEVRAGFKGCPGGVWALAFSPDGRTLAAGTGLPNAGEVRLWDVGTGELRATLRGKTGAVTCLAFTPDGAALLAGSRDWFTTRRRLPAGEEEYTRCGGFLALSPDGRRCAAVGPNDSVVLLDAGTGDVRGTRTGHRGPISAAAFAPDGQTFVTASWDQTARLWDAQLGENPGDGTKH